MPAPGDARRMTQATLIYDRPVTLVGGGHFDREMLAEALAVAPVMVAADGAADLLANWGEHPRAVIGDMDSIADMAWWHERDAEIVHLPEQDSTDFDKCLYATEAPFYVGTGFTGGRMDQSLYAFHAMLNRPTKKVILLAETEAIALLPAETDVTVELEPGALVSFFPLKPATGVSSSGLHWPLDGLRLAPGVLASVSNQAVDTRVTVRFDSVGVLMFVQRRHLGDMVRAIAGSW